MVDIELDMKVVDTKEIEVIEVVVEMVETS